MGRADIAPGVIVALCGFLGVIVAFIEYTLYNRGIGSDALLTAGLDLTSFMVITVVLSLLFGVIVAMVKH